MNFKIAHISDTHIRIASRHEEYRTVFSEIYKILKKEKPDLIVHVGDLFHSKINLSPEAVDSASEFLKNLADIAPTKVIVGNHDLLVKNRDRLDSISPIVKNLNHPSLELYLNSGEHEVSENVVLNVLSIVDTDNWILSPTNSNKINIALYHGSVRGVETDTGYKMEHADLEIDTFKEFDYVLLGDLHKANQILDNDGRARYCGSTIQQNFGETNDKGFLIWEIEDKEKFECRHIAIPNPNPFISIHIQQDGTLEEVKIPAKARLRVISEFNLPIETTRKAINVAKTKFKPESLVFVNKADANAASVSISNSFKKEDLRDIGVQENLIKEYLKDYSIDDNLFSRIFEINKKYSSIVESKETFTRNVNYQILDFEWDNLFNYGEGNKIDFTKLSGLVGIFGKNFSGKSSIIDGLLYSMFNSITKNSRKKTKIINKEKNNASGKVSLQIGSKKYIINRSSEKYTKRLKGAETIEAKTALDFSAVDLKTQETESLNGIDRIETDKSIAKLFGSFDDFLSTSMSSQLGALSYIEKGSTERKEILAKFLDVDFFAEKFDLANKESVDIKAVIKKFENKNFDKEIESAEIELLQNKNVAKQQEECCKALKEKISEKEREIISLKQEIESSPTELIDVSFIRKQIDLKQKEIASTVSAIESLEQKNKENETKIQKVNEFIESFDIQLLKNKNKIIEENEKLLETLLNEIKDSEKDLSHDQKKVSILKDVPCGPEYSHCKFIKGAYEAQEQISIVKLLLEKKEQAKKEVSDKIKELDDESTKEQIKKYELLLQKKDLFSKEMKNFFLQIENKKQSLKVFQMELDNLKQKEQQYEENKEKTDKIEQLILCLSEHEQDLSKQNKELAACNEKLKEVYRNYGFFEQKIEKLNGEKTELQQMRENYEAYDLFLKCMHSSGIAYDIIKKSLPKINEEIAKILSNIVDFQVYFENEDNRLEIYIKRDGDTETLPIEMGSGAQKAMAAMAIRLAFINISSLPKSDLFILDEPGTSLDQENMEGFIRMLDVIKSHFRCVILISHLDSIRDVADTVITIEQKDGFAHVCI